MSSEVFNLAILLSVKDAASGTFERFSANAHRATENIKKDLQSLDKTSREQIGSITKEIGKKTKEIDKLGVQLNKVDSLNNKGLGSAGKRSANIASQLQNESKGLDELSKKLRADGKEDAAKSAEKLSAQLKEQGKQVESVGTKLKKVQELRRQGTEEAKRQASVLEAEVKKEVKSLDELTTKLKEVKDFRINSLDVKIKSDGLKQQISQIELFEKHYEKLRENLNRDLAIGGVGVAGLIGLKKGVDEAGSYETTVLNLKQAYQEVASASGKTSEQQATDIRKIMAMATELGNLLQGNTSDYANIFTAMNKAGIDAETTLNGAGRAAAYLANVTGAIRKGTAPQLAEDLGSYGKMFDLKGDDYMKVVELFSALEDRFNIGSESLIESSKYFFSTAKGVMNLRGLSGAEDTAKLFAFSKRYAGREGSEAGTSLDAIITQFISHKEKVQALAKDKGIKLEFFDAKGSFQGIENMFVQFEKLKKLSPEERGIRLNDIFGEQGARIASAMVEQGVEGWRNITAEANKSVSVNDKINQQMQTYEAKTEALSGSWQNFKATAFTPLMEDAKKFVDYGNNIVGVLQKFAAESPGLTGTLGTLALYGSTALVVYSGFKTLTTGVRLFRLASAFSRGEGLLPYLNSTTSAATSASTAMTTATAKATGLRGVLQSIGKSNVVRIGVQIGAIMGIEYAISKAIESYMAAVDATKGKNEAIKSNYYVTTNALSDPNLDADRKLEIAKSDAQASLFSLQKRGLLKTFGLEKSKGWGEWINDTVTVNPFQNKTWLNYDREKATKTFQSDAPTLGNPQVMREFLKYLPERIPGKDEQSVKAREEITRTAQAAFPDSFATAMKELSGITFAPLTQGMAEMSQQFTNQNQTITIFGQAMTDLQNPLSQVNSNFIDVGNSAQKVPVPLNNVANSANRASVNLDSFSNKLVNWQPPNIQAPSALNVPSGFSVPSGQSPFNSIYPPPKASGGRVLSDGLVYVHKDEDILPANVTSKYEGGLRNLKNVAYRGAEENNSNQPITINYNPQITINGADADTEQKFSRLLNKHAKEIDRIVGRQMQKGRVRS